MTSATDGSHRSAPASRHQASDACSTEGAFHDRALNHIFAAGLTIAALLGRPDVGPEIARRLGEVIDELDNAVAAVRNAAWAVASGDRDVAGDAENTSQPVTRDGANPATNGRRLHRVSDEVFAYALRGHNFYRTSDHVLWAHDSNGVLLSARTGAPFARRNGHVFYDLEGNAPLYYEHDHTEAISSAPASFLPPPALLAPDV